MENIISEYDQQAINFLESTKTEFTTEFKEFGSMPWDKDGTKRNIFNVTLSNERGKYSFLFGASIADSCKPTPKINSNEACEIYFSFKHGDPMNILFSHKIKTTYKDLRELKNDQLIDKKQLRKDFDAYKLEIAKYNQKLKKQGMQGSIYSRFGYIEQIIDQICLRISMKRSEAQKETTLLDQADNVIHPSAYSVLACLQKYDVGTFEDFCSEFGYDTDSRTASKTYRAVLKEFRALSKMFNKSELEQLQEIQ